jgi:hypothetical protein
MYSIETSTVLSHGSRAVEQLVPLLFLFLHTALLNRAVCAKDPVLQDGTQCLMFTPATSRSSQHLVNIPCLTGTG